jgi:multidrug efflux pump subunit AcrB
MKAPIEVRLIGPDLEVLKSIGERVAAVFRATPGAMLVRSDFGEDSYRLTVTVKPQVANQLGISNAKVARTLAASFLGVPVSTYWEGDRSVPIVLRLDESRRESLDHVTGAYITSDLTGARIPLREVASLEPTWQTSRIVHRNGTPTLTIRSQVAPGMLPADVLARAAPVLDTLTLPAGYRHELGGEIESRTETFREMMVALAVSLLAIFLILLLLFKVLSDTLMVMSAIPLSLFGALLGLILTGNPFGFTAFVGVIALSGIVVRNAIILIDFFNHERRAGMPIEQAALEAGRRRLRPIFLTTMAAAVGVLPMILSGSGMWSPLASVLAVGLISSMVLTLFVVPVLLVVVNRRREARLA